MARLTRDQIHAFLNQGAPNRAQCKILEISYPLPKGWMRGLENRHFSEEEIDALHRLRHTHGDPHLPTRIAEPSEQESKDRKIEALISMLNVLAGGRQDRVYIYVDCVGNGGLLYDLFRDAGFAARKIV